MAARYWVGGTDNWGTTAGLKWSTTSGGAGGAATPAITDDVFIDAASGAVTITKITGAATILSLDFTGFTGTFANANIVVGMNSGSLTMATGMTYTVTTGGFSFSGAGTYTITSRGKVLGQITKYASGTLLLGDALDVRGGNAGYRTFRFDNGTLNTNGFVLKCSVFRSNTASTRTLTTTTAGCIEIYGVAGVTPVVIWDTSVVTGLTITAGGKIRVFSPSIGGGYIGSIISSGAITLPTLEVSIVGYNLLQLSAPTFAGLIADSSGDGSSNYNEILLSNDVTVAGNLTLKSYSTTSYQVTLKSTSAGFQRVLSCSGTVIADKITVKDNIAAGVSSPFYATESVLSNTTNWILVGAAATKHLMLVGVGQ